MVGYKATYWLQVWDHARSNKEAAFMQSIWHKDVAVNEWRACSAPIYIFEQCDFLPPKHK